MQEIAEAVSSELQNYANRGVFQNFSTNESTNGSTINYRFHWLAQSPFQIGLDTNKSELELKNVLPSVPFRSAMDKDFRAFVKQRCDVSIPVHRRLDAERFDFTCRNRQQKLSVTIGFKAADAGDAAKTAINLLHEIFNNFLQEGPYQNYMVEFFNIPEE